MRQPRLWDSLAVAAEDDWASLIPLVLVALTLAAGRVRLRHLVSLQQIVDALCEGALAVHI